MASHPEKIELKYWPVASKLNPGPLKTLLHKLGLEKQYPNKLTLRSLLEINKDSISDDAVDSLKAVPWYFLKKLLIANAGCRSCTYLPEDESSIDLYRDENTEDSEVNLLDLITALFLCADSFLQQEMALKMSMCQFAVPLLLPQGTGSQSTLMLWALRDILKEWRPHALSESKGFEEGNIVFEQIPLISFVRLQACSMSKSQLLNHVLCHSQQIHNIFTHKDMDGGAAPRTISDGLVEACWYLPCGNRNGDIFSEPLTIANLRGDICASEAQFSFLTQVSTAIFVFLDSVDEEEQKLLLSLGDMGSKLFLVVNSKGKVSHNVETSVKEILDAFKLKSNNTLIRRPNENLAKFSHPIRKAMNNILKESTSKISIESMSNEAIELGLSVDECKTEASKLAAEEILKGIGDQSIVDYKRNQLPLQGEHWKQLAKIEKEECRLKYSGGNRLEEYKAKLQEDKLKIRREQNKYKTTTAMASFLGFLATTDKEEKALFLKWLQLKLDMRSRKDLSSLRNRFQEQSLVKQDKKCLEELDQCILDSSLGIEHFMREMGQIYEASRLGNPQASAEHCPLPALAAELLLDGYPFELLDGDASNIPEKWVTDVLMELHRKVGEKSKLLVLTVLGVQSTGKSTLLNTMFGVQFPVSSGRCTRGAFMLFLRVGEDMRKDLSCDFILLIDTEGLKSPSLAQLDESSEHDNELATLVIGLSDITIINIAMENSTEMNDVLQIAVHAFLRMKEVGKMPVCHFVHQNAAGLSAHNKNVTDRKHILDRLNEMTQIAAEMEKRPSVNKFTDVLDYDADKNNWYIPGLWHGTPPMAPVNTGYSETVLNLKKNLLEVLKTCRYEEHSQIPEFIEWMKSLWKAVKYENFIFSFRNTLVAQAYDNLWKEMTEWEWESRKKIYTWQTKADLQISNHEVNSFENQAEIQDFKESLKSEALKMVATLEKEMTEKLDAYYKRKDRNVSLIENNKMDFFHHIRDVHRDILNTENYKLDMAVKLKISTIEADDIHRKQKVRIEQKILQLLQNSSDSKTPLSDEQLEDEFGKMWSREVVKISGLEEQDIPSYVFKQLRGDFSNRNVNEEFQNVETLTAYGKEAFKARDRHICNMTKFKLTMMFGKRKAKESLQRFSQSVIDTCTRLILDSTKSQTDYHDSLTKEVLEKINESLKENYRDLKTNTKFEVDLKLHICGIASREFLQMHRNFVLRKDPQKRLKESRNQYFSAFVDLYRERDHCRHKAQDFAQHGLRPAILQYINKFLGTDIVDEMVKSSHAAEYSSRASFQYSILKELLEKDDFLAFVKYFHRYEIYVKDLICQHIKQCFSAEMSFDMLKNKRLKEINQKIKEAIEKARKPLPNDTKSVTEFMKNLRKYLGEDISISIDTVEGVLFQISTTCDPFTTSLHESLSDLKQQMQDEFSKSIDIIESLYTLPIKPQDELFKRVSGCAKQCPFCKMPCDAGGKEHRQHYANAHRPQALGSYRSVQTQELVETLCTTNVNSEKSFKNEDTDWELHPFKDYRTYYPEWNIQPDSTDEASDYWKYVLATYNDRLAVKHNAKPAVIPEAWKSITKAQALEGLKVAFGIKV